MFKLSSVEDDGRRKASQDEYIYEALMKKGDAFAVVWLSRLNAHDKMVAHSFLALASVIQTASKCPLPVPEA